MKAISAVSATMGRSAPPCMPVPNASPNIAYTPTCPQRPQGTIQSGQAISAPLRNCYWSSRAIRSRPVPNAMEPMLTLYDFGNSVCCQKVRITLCEKGLDWEASPVNLFRSEQYDPAYLKLNPKGVVPTLVHDGKPVNELTLICEYIDETFPEPPLMPKDPWQRSRARTMEQAGRRRPVRGRRRDQLLGDVPRAAEDDAAGTARTAHARHRRSAPQRPLQIDLRARRAVAACALCHCHL